MIKRLKEINDQRIKICSSVLKARFEDSNEINNPGGLTEEEEKLVETYIK